MVAEGIETQSQLTTLEEMGCKMAQGFLLGEPSPAEAVGSLLGSVQHTRAVGSQAV